MPLDLLAVRDTVHPTLVEQLAPAEVINVSVSEETDHDGDPVLRVKVTFRAEKDSLEAKQVFGLIRHLRTALADRGEDRFPLVTFQTEAEADEENT